MSVSDIGATAPISALTYAFSIGLDRGQATDDFGPRIIARRAGIEEESEHLRQELNRIRQVIEQMGTGIANRSNLFRTFIDEGSASTNRIRLARTQESNQPRTRFDDLSVEVTARLDPCKHYAGLDRNIEQP